MKISRIAAGLSAVLTAFSVSAAVYDINVLTTNDLASNGFGQAIDEQGNTVIVLQNLYNQPIDLTLIDFENEQIRDSLNDPEGAEQGNFDDEDYIALITGIRNNTAQNGPFNQRLALFRSYLEADNGEISEFAGFDIPSPNYEGLTKSTQVLVRDMIDNDFFIGTGDAPFAPLDYTDEEGNVSTFVLNEYRRRAFVQRNNTIIPLVSADQTLGGYSTATQINNRLEVSGSVMVSVSESVDTVIENCLDDESRGDTPVEFCLWRLSYPLVSGAGTDRGVLEVQASLRPIIWSLDDSGNIIDTQVYDLLFTPGEDDTTQYQAEALGINDLGIAVGISDTDEQLNIGAFSNNRRDVAVVFRDGQTTEFLNREDSIFSRALGINNNNWVVGTRSQAFNNVARSKLFVYNLDSQESQFPNGYFLGSGTEPRAINNNNIVVGEGEIEALTDSVREKHAFMYEIESDTFTNLNTLIECDTPYTLVDAVDINDNNEILVNARARLPLLDVRGEPVLDEEGQNVITDTAVVLKLTPVPNGEPDTCEEVPGEQPLPPRQGASSGQVGYWLLLMAIMWRRFVRNRY